MEGSYRASVCTESEEGQSRQGEGTPREEGEGNGSGTSHHQRAACASCSPNPLLQKNNGPKGAAAKLKFGFGAAKRFFQDVNPLRISDEKAAIRIQKVYRGHRSRTKLRKRLKAKALAAQKEKLVKRAGAMLLFKMTFRRLIVGPQRTWCSTRAYLTVACAETSSSKEGSYACGSNTNAGPVARRIGAQASGLLH